MSSPNAATANHSITNWFSRYLATLDPSTVRLRPGKILIRQDPPDAQVGAIVIPESARVMSRQEPSRTGVVLAVNRKTVWKENGKTHTFELDSAVIPGVRVVYGLLLNELGEDVVLTDVRRVHGIVE